jgi:hypothetical protein
MCNNEGEWNCKKKSILETFQNKINTSKKIRINFEMKNLMENEVKKKIQFIKPIQIKEITIKRVETLKKKT